MKQRQKLWIPILMMGALCGSGRAQTSVEKPYEIPKEMRSATLTGEAFLLERIGIPFDAVLHISVSGRVAGAETVPLAAQVIRMTGGVTRFSVPMPDARPVPPYRVQVLVVADNRLWARSFAPQTYIRDPNKPLRIRLRLVPAPQNIDGIGDGKPLPKTRKKK